MKEFLGWLLKGYAALAGYAVAVLLVIVAFLWGSGALTVERLGAGFEALRGRTPVPVGVTEKKAPDDLSEREQILDMKSQVLQKLDDRTSARLSLIKAEQEAL